MLAYSSILMNGPTPIYASAPLTFGFLALLARHHSKALVVLLVLWCASSAAQILWAFYIQRRNAFLGKTCASICLTQLVAFGFLFIRYLPLSD